MINYILQNAQKALIVKN